MALPAAQGHLKGSPRALLASSPEHLPRVSNRDMCHEEGPLIKEHGLVAMPQAMLRSPKLTGLH
jgi:hypothetical protein